jgi:hypothetical protein
MKKEFSRENIKKSGGRALLTQWPLASFPKRFLELPVL